MQKRIENHMQASLPYLSSQNPLSSPLKDGVDFAHTKALIVHRGSRYTIWYKAQPLRSGELDGIGSASVLWERVSRAHSPHVSRNLLPVSLPLISVMDVPYSVNVSSPTEGIVGQPLTFIVEVLNLTCFALEFSFSISESESFMIAGFKKTNFKILGYSTERIRTTLIPITTGKLHYPQFTLHSRKYPNLDLLCTKQINGVLVRPLSSDPLWN
jgi:hypothetical protein